MYMCIKIQDVHFSEEEKDPGSSTSSGISEQREFYMYLHRQW